jgi:NodT family efflux transporter outer membrane factor (OMF) lipoprotein
MVNEARSQRIAATLDVAAARLALTAAVTRSYFELDRQYQFADIAQQELEQRELILEITRSRVESGLDTTVELRQAESAVPQARIELSHARAGIELAGHELAALAGRGTQASDSLTRPHLELSSALALPQRLPVDLLARRPDVLAARSRVDAADSAGEVARTAFYPDISLTAFAGTAAIGFGQLFHAASGTYGAGPALHLPLFDAGRLKADYRGASAEIDYAVNAYNGVVVDAVRDTADQLSLIAALKPQLEDQRQSLDAAELAYRLAVDRYRAGVTGQLNVLAAETLVLGARRQGVSLARDDAIARVALLIAIGGSFDPTAVPSPSSSAPPHSHS